MKSKENVSQDQLIPDISTPKKSFCLVLGLGFYFRGIWACKSIAILEKDNLIYKKNLGFWVQI